MNTTIISGSANIAVLDSKIVVDLCVGKFFVDVSPSTFLGEGANNVLGASIQILNPNDIPLKDYSLDYDILPPMDGVFEFNIPTEGGAYQFGEYRISVKLTDSDQRTHVIEKTVSICKISGSKGKVGKISASMRGVCRDGRLYVSLNQLPVYNKLVATNSDKTLTLYYPTSSGQDSLQVTSSAFTTILFEGVYELSGQLCAEYSDVDNISYSVKYDVSAEKDVKCSIDDCAVFSTLVELSNKLKDGCTDKDREDIGHIVLDALRLYHTAKLGQDCGEDISEYIKELEDLLGCRCTTESDEGTPVSGINTPSKNFVIEGCNITSDSSGDTTTYKIDNYEYLVRITPNGGAFTISENSIEGCKKVQILSFNVGKVYDQIKQLVRQDGDAWVEAITIGGVTLKEFLNNLSQEVQECCDGTGGSGCAAVITTHAHSQSGASVLLTWTHTGAARFNILVDGELAGSVTSNAFVITGGANGVVRNYSIIPLCESGEEGAAATGTFNYTYCPPIAKPILKSLDLLANCPYDLSQNIETIAGGTSAEWHNADNTSISTRVDTPTAVGAGTYYLFARDANGCYSPSVSFKLSCIGLCTAPKNLTVLAQETGFLVRFESADNPPPNNAYTVLRRLASAADINANYTSIGTPTFNAQTNRWEINDVSAINNTAYVYRAVSLCSDVNRPHIDYAFENTVGETCTPVTGVSVTIEALDTPLGARWGWTPTDPYQMLVDAGVVPTMQGSVVVPHVAHPVETDFRAMPSQYFAIYEEDVALIEKVRVVDTGAPFNAGDIPDSTWREPYVIAATGKRYYVTRIPTDFDKSSSARVIFEPTY